LLRKGKVKSEEDIAEIEKIMLEKGIQNHETAADYFQWMRQAATPTPSKTFNQNVLDETARGTLEKFWKNPAAAARDVGFAGTPLICAVEIDVPGALDRIIRVLMHVESDKNKDEISHIYLHGATALRKDLAQ
jgi:hypothetical protein